MVLGSHPAHPQARLVPPSGPVDTADAADPASRPPAVLTVNAALHRVTLCRHQQRALQGHGGRHPAGLPEHHVRYLEPLQGASDVTTWRPSRSPSHPRAAQGALPPPAWLAPGPGEACWAVPEP